MMPEATPPAWRYAVGADMGSTNTRIALVRSDGHIVKLLRERGSRKGLRNLDARIAQLEHMYARLLAAPEARGIVPSGIGIGVGGQISLQGEIVGHNGPRDPDYQPVAFLEKARAALNADLPITVDNDSKAATLGEFLYGAGKGTRHMVGITVGTGIGGGVIVDGRLLHGALGLAGHLGFVSVDMHGPRCPSGVVGCMERYASGTGIGVAAREALARRPEGRMLALAGGDIDKVTSDLAFDAAEQGDALALEVIENAAYALGVAIASIIHVLNPDLVVLGGGVAERGEIFLSPVRRTVQDVSLVRYANTPIKVAEMGDSAGVVGAAALTGFPAA